MLWTTGPSKFHFSWTIIAALYMLIRDSILASNTSTLCGASNLNNIVHSTCSSVANLAFLVHFMLFLQIILLILKLSKILVWCAGKVTGGKLVLHSGFFTQLFLKGWQFMSPAFEIKQEIRIAFCTSSFFQVKFQKNKKIWYQLEIRYHVPITMHYAPLKA